MKRVHVWTTKDEIEVSRLQDSAAVVMDVLMATTTLVTMMESGARRVFPVGSVEDALRLASLLDAPVIKGGEEGGREIPGFDLGPLPTLYTPEAVGGRDVVFVTTNGTRAIVRAENAGELFIASLRNAPATAEHVASLGVDDVYLICAGSGGHLSLEDFVCAGVLARLLPAAESYNDAALAAMALAEQQSPLVWLKQGRVGRWLTRHDQADLVAFAADVGASDAVVAVEGRQLRLVSGHARETAGAKERKP
ncbi:MAG: 2-phosphosulfolactate phosphatase [Thermoflavifilum sp.]|nr:2-phosphosulfolactate phosphatase [Thermoflavifilum sp.]MCL6513596.1 2-phosphosulfolactate phosphatase [Alicyclobacillus sp.]